MPSVPIFMQVNVNPPDWDGYTEPNPPPLPEDKDKEGEAPPITGHWNERLTSFQKLIMVKCFMEEKVHLQEVTTLK